MGAFCGFDRRGLYIIILLSAISAVLGFLTSSIVITILSGCTCYWSYDDH